MQGHAARLGQLMDRAERLAYVEHMFGRAKICYNIEFGERIDRVAEINSIGRSFVNRIDRRIWSQSKKAIERCLRIAVGGLFAGVNPRHQLLHFLARHEFAHRALQYGALQLNILRPEINDVVQPGKAVPLG